MTLRTSAMVFAVAASLVGVNCGGSDASSDTPASAGQDTQVDDVVDGGNSSDLADATGVSKACLDLSLAIATAAGSTAPSDSGDVSVDVDSLNKSFEAIKSQAPNDIRADIDIVKKGLSTYLGILAKYENDFTAMMADEEAMATFNSVFADEEYVQASERFNSWMDSICGS